MYRSAIIYMAFSGAALAESHVASPAEILVGPTYNITVPVKDPVSSAILSVEITANRDGELENVELYSNTDGARYAGCIRICVASGRYVYYGCGGGGGTFDEDTFLVDVAPNSGDNGSIDYAVTLESLVTRQTSSAMVFGFMVDPNGAANFSLDAQ